MSNTKIIRILNLFTYILTIVINVIAMFNLLGFSTKEISDAYPVLLMPIGLTFSIVWTLIYLFLGVYTVYQLIAKNDETCDDIGIYYLTSNILNVLWILAFHTKLMLISTVIIIGLLIDLYIIDRKVKKAGFITKTTFNLYFGWISVASVVSIFSYISSIDPGLYNSNVMKVATIIALLGLTMVGILKSKDMVYTSVIVIAMVGILLKHLIDFDKAYPEIILTLLLGIIITSAISLVNVLSKNKGVEIKNESI